MEYSEFAEHVLMGREIEMHYKTYEHFIGSSNKYPNYSCYIANVETKELQYFDTRQELLDNAIIEGLPLKEAFKDIVIDYIL